MKATRTPAGVVFLLAALVLGSAAHANGLSWAYRYVLVDAEDEDSVTPPMGAVAFTPAARDRESCDLVAEILWQNQARKLGWGTAATHALRALTYCPEGGRYSDVVDAARHSATAVGAGEQYGQYRTMNPRGAPEQYKPGSVDIDALRGEQRRRAVATLPTPEQAQALADMPSTATIDDMIAAAGTPTHVQLHGVRIKDIISVEVRQLWFYYRGIGRVTFDFQRDSGWIYQGLIADPMAFEESMPYRSQAAQLGLPSPERIALIQLLSGNASAIKASAQGQYRSPQTSSEYLDTAAELLLQRHAQIANTGATDAYAWICNVLSDRGGPRYAGVLKTVAATTKDEKLQRFAKQRVRAAAGSDSRPYGPGTISLEEQAKKYPTLYPQITLIRGLL
jgi:hypothetical protein